MFFNKYKNEDKIIKKLSDISENLNNIVEMEKKKSFSKEKKKDIDQDIDEMLNRFYKLFELHEVKTCEIPQIIDPKFNISIFNISSKENLLKIITTELLQWLADFFEIQLDWLLNKTDRMYKIQNFDKFYISLFKMINSLSKEKSFIIDVFKNCNLEKNDSNEQKQIIYPIVRIKLFDLNNKTIYKNVPLNYYIWDYKRSRIDFKVIIYMLYNGYIDYYKRKIYLDGYNKSKVSYYDFIDGKISYSQLKGCHSTTWYPSDYIEEANSNVSLESDEFKDIIKQIENEKLIKATNDYLEFWDSNDSGNYSTIIEEENTLNKVDQEYDDKTILYTEGKTDCSHIETAWRILNDEEKHNFKFIAFNGISKLSNHIRSINSELENHISSNKNIIAIFDSDSAGIKEFKNLIKQNSNSNFGKAKNSNKIYIVLLPEPNNDLKGLCEIEFLYPLDILKKYDMLVAKNEHDIFRLDDDRKITIEILKKIEDNQELDNLKYYNIDENKKSKFALDIQNDNNLTKKDLNGFKSLFKLIKKVESL